MASQELLGDTPDLWPLDALPWPLATCLGAIEDLEKLRDFSRLLREGAFGDATDWAASGVGGHLMASTLRPFGTFLLTASRWIILGTLDYLVTSA